MASPSSAKSQPSSRVYPPRRRRAWQQEIRDWLWLVLWVTLLIGSGIMGTWALGWLTRIPPVPNCDEISRLSSNRDRIYCAKTQSRSGSPDDLISAIGLTTHWPKIHPDYKESQDVLKTASEKLMFLANQRVQSGDLEGGTALAKAIPPGTPLRKPAQAAIYEWRQEWTAGEALEKTLATAIQSRNWVRADETLQTLKTLKRDYWLRDRYQHWQFQLQREQRSWESLVAARELANSGKPQDLAQAITLARQVALGSRVWVETEQDIDRWSETLLAYALLQWQSGKRDAAIAAAQKVPPSPNWSPEAQVLVKFAHAQQLVVQSAPTAPTYQPSYAHLFYLMEAIRAVESIPPDNALYSQAQASLQAWKAQLQDASTLQMAQTVAKLGQGPAYQVALAQARQIEPKRPRRIQAQTLIAQWQNELERIADRPLLRRADQLAKPGTIPALQQAIAEASQIQLGRALRPDAQTRIADWRREIQVIEDRPIIDEAVALAQKDKLKEAIQSAQKIKADRALYARAQSLVQDWTRTIQIREDQPILDEAKDLAYEGSLSAAISLASQIAPGRALYPEAKRAIDLWEDERDYIWSIWEADDPAADPEQLSEPSSAPEPE